jgi:hypothetical protein
MDVIATDGSNPNPGPSHKKKSQLRPSRGILLSFDQHDRGFSRGHLLSPKSERAESAHSKRVAVPKKYRKNVSYVNRRIDLPRDDEISLIVSWYSPQGPTDQQQISSASPRDDRERL